MRFTTNRHTQTLNFFSFLILFLSILAFFITGCDDRSATGQEDGDDVDGDYEEPEIVLPSSDGDTTPKREGKLQVIDMLEYGAVQYTESLTKELSLVNVGNADLQIDDISLSDATTDEFALVELFEGPLFIEPGKNILVPITYAPTNEGADTGVLIIYSQDPESPVTRVNLSSQYKGTVSLGFSPEAIDFGIEKVGNELVWKTITLSNSLYDISSNMLLIIGEIYIETDTPAVFRLEPNLPDQHFIKQGDDFSFDVGFDPTDENQYSATVKIATNDPMLDDGIATIAVTAEAALPHISLTPEPAENQIDFGPNEINSKAIFPLTINSVGNLPLTIKNIKMISTEGVFGIENENGETINSDLLQEQVLDPTQSMMLNITYIPQNYQVDVGELYIESDAEGQEPYITRVALRGMGSDFAPVLEPTLIDFGDVLLGSESESRTFTIYNRATEAFTVTGGTFNLPSNEFYISPPADVDLSNHTLQIGEQLTVSTVYSPSNEGQSERVLTITLDLPSVPSLSLTLRGRGTLELNAQPLVEPESPFDIGSTYPNGTLTAPFAVRNNGTSGELLVLGALVRYDDNDVFKIVYNDDNYPRPHAIVPGGADIFPFTLAFSPRESGNFTAEVVVSSTAGAEVFETIIEISGTGIPCADGCWNLDDNPADCEYCNCYISNLGVEICDGTDNDCNGITDDQDSFELLSNCIAPNHAYSVCINGECGFDCDTDFHLCDTECVYDYDINNCGSECSPCIVPDYAQGWCRDVGTGPECQFECVGGYVRIGDSCHKENQTECCGADCLNCYDVVNAPDHGHPACINDTCIYLCDVGYHQCDDACLWDYDTLSCGTSCTPCLPPQNATATCNGNACDFTCNEGFRRIDNECIENNGIDCCGNDCEICLEAPDNAFAVCNGVTCDFACHQGFHRCGDLCLPDGDVNSCGSLCSPCTEPQNGQAVCDNLLCDINCFTGFHRFENTCIPNENPDCCGDECIVCIAPDNSSPVCIDGQCEFICDDGFTKDVDICLPDEGDPDCCGDACEICVDAPENAIPICLNNECTFSCISGYHECNGVCVSIYDPNNCGTSCEQCDAPEFGYATCDGQQCNVACYPNFHEVDEKCIDNTDVSCCGGNCLNCPDIFPNHSNSYCLDGEYCSYTCNQGFHKCDGVCLSNYSIYSCGHSCDPCPTVENGQPICLARHCEIICNEGFHKTNNDYCLPNDTTECCGIDCERCGQGPSNGSVDCVDNQCLTTCDEGYHLCNGYCVDNDSIEHCGTLCEPCTSPQYGYPVCTEAAACDFECSVGYLKDGDTCVEI